MEERAAVADYVDYYNRDRPQPGLGGHDPGREEEFFVARPQMLPAVIGQPASENGLGSAA